MIAEGWSQYWRRPVRIQHIKRGIRRYSGDTTAKKKCNFRNHFFLEKDIYYTNLLQFGFKAYVYIYIYNYLLLALSLLLLLLLLYIIIYFHYRYYYSNIYIYIFILTGFCFNPLLTDDYVGLQYPIITIRLMLITIDDWRLFLLNGWSSHPKLVDDHNSCWEIRSEPQVEEGLRRCSTCLPQGREPKLRGGRGGLTVTIDHGWKKGDHPRLISGWWIIINCDNDAPRKSFNCVWMLNIKKTYGRSSLKCL